MKPRWIPDGGQKTDLSIFGQESNPTTWRLAHMNLALRVIEANLGAQPADSFLRNLHPDLKADAEPFAKKYPRLLAELEACFGEGERLMAVGREQLTGVHDGEAA